jgi:hypothetical protein
MIIRRMMPGRRRYSPAERDAILAAARRAVREGNELIRGPNIVRHEAYKALFAIKKMFAAAEPSLRRMFADDRAAWQTRQKLLEQWLERIAERGI